VALEAESRRVTRVERVGRVLVVEMRRAAKRNAVDRVLADELDAAFNLLEDDPELWAGVLTGSGGVFSAGSDLTSGGDYVTERGGEYGLIRRRRTKPLVAAVEGPALGGGLELVLACDLVVADGSAVFGLPEVCRGLVPTCGGLFRGPSALPVNLAKEMVLTGEPVGARRAYEAGLVNRIAEDGGARAAAVALAERICANSPVAVRESLRAMDHYLAVDDDLGWEATDRAQTAIRESADAEEGIAAFLEKRPPVWPAR